MDELVPCPFCGGGHVLGDGEGDDNWFECMGCHARGPRTTFIDATDTDADRDAWNRRVPAPADPALLALARLGAWVASSHADEPGDVFAPDIEDAEDKFGVVVTHRPPVGICALGGERGDDCSCSEYYGRDEQCECRLFAPGITDAIAALLAPDGAGGVADA